MVDCEEAKKLEQLYIAWDRDRAKGRSVAVGITDATFGAVVTGQATFTSAPSFTYASPAKTIVSFGLMGV